MSFNSNTIKSTGSGLTIADVQRLQPLGDSGRKKRENPKQKPQPKAEVIEIEEDVDTTIYTPSGQVEGDEHGVRLDVSA